MKDIGKIDWVFTAGKLPFAYHGNTPELMSNDQLAILNTSDKKAMVALYIFYEDRSPVGPYNVKIMSGRLKKIRLNDLIDPEAMQLERNYSCYIKSTQKVVVQFSRLNTGSKHNAEMTTMAYPVDD